MGISLKNIKLSFFKNYNVNEITVNNDCDSDNVW